MINNIKWLNRYILYTAYEFTFFNNHIKKNIKVIPSPGEQWLCRRWSLGNKKSEQGGAYASSDHMDNVLLLKMGMGRYLY